MTDQCRHCVAYGNAEMCDRLECGVHDSWYSNRLRAEIERLEKAHEFAIDCTLGKLTTFDQVFGAICRLEIELEAARKEAAAAKREQGAWYDQGVIDGLSAYAHWRDGEERVGTTGKTLKRAIAERKVSYFFQPRPHVPDKGGHENAEHPTPD